MNFLLGALFIIYIGFCAKPARRYVENLRNEKTFNLYEFLTVTHTEKFILAVICLAILLR